MPTKKKRIGFIPKVNVLKVIDDISEKENLSNSKVVNILLEEALYTRGLIKENMLADINIIDFDNLQLYAPELVSDLPAGGKRLIQNVDGYDATIKSGVITYNKGVATKKLPGRLIRN